MCVSTFMNHIKISTVISLETSLLLHSSGRKKKENIESSSNDELLNNYS